MNRVTPIVLEPHIQEEKIIGALTYNEELKELLTKYEAVITVGYDKETGEITAAYPTLRTS